MVCVRRIGSAIFLFSISAVAVAAPYVVPDVINKVPYTPTHAASVPTVTLTTTLQDAYRAALALPGRDAIIIVPTKRDVAGNVVTHRDCDTLWDVRQNFDYKNITIRGADPHGQGKRPLFSCSTGKNTWVSYGQAFANSTGKLPTHQGSLTLENLEVRGYTTGVVFWNNLTLRLNNMNVHHIGGTGISVGERARSQFVDMEMTNSYVGFSGNGNTYHLTYVHGGYDTGYGTGMFRGNVFESPDHSHGLKVYFNTVLVDRNLFLNPCDSTRYCGTEMLDVGAGAELSVISNNVFDINVGVGSGDWVMYFLNREYQLPSSTGPLFTPFIGRPEWYSYFTLAAAGGVSDALPNPPSAFNERLRRHFVFNNTFNNRGAKKLSAAILLHGSYPLVNVPWNLNCVMPAAPLPQGWFDVTRLYVANNTFTGNIAKLAESKTARCWGDPIRPGVQVPAPIEATQIAPPVDVGGNGAPGTPRIALPTWFRTGMSR